MADLDDVDFGADTDAIRKWLAKRATYAGDQGDPVRGGKHREDLPGTIDPNSLAIPNTRDAGRDVIDALLAPEPPVATRWPAPYKPAKDPAETVATDPAAAGYPTPPPRTGTTPGQPSPYASTPEHEEELTTSRSTNAVFKPRKGVRNTITLVLVASVAMTAAAGYRAYEVPTSLNYGLTAIVAVLTLIVWGVRASTSVTELAVIRGQLEIICDGKFEVVDLASVYTPVAIQGKPGHRGWKVLIERHDEPLLVIDRSMVDPHRFTAVLHRVRPDLRPTPATPEA
ncbi:hypothetical protein ACJ5H2_22605 (plasmid) [Nocardioides sp. R1-1]|uniref:hypothetical protein n=1 Tax=Nocardioides sp. R1-1 TaxID=3383502 RepID=UPI0038D074D3